VLLRVPAEWPFELEELGLSRSPHPAARVAELSQGPVLRPFALDRGPLLRGALFKRGPRDHELVLVFLHLVVDGESLEVLGDDLAAAYGGAPLPPAVRSYADFVRAQERLLRQGTEARLDGAPALELPLDRARGPRWDHRGQTLALHLSPQEVRQLRGTGRHRQLLRVAAVLLLHRWCDAQADVVLGVAASHRPDCGHPEDARLVGLFANPLPLRVRVPLRAPARDVVEAVDAA